MLVTSNTVPLTPIFSLFFMKYIVFLLKTPEGKRILFVFVYIVKMFAIGENISFSAVEYDTLDLKQKLNLTTLNRNSICIYLLDVHNIILHQKGNFE